MSDVVKDEQLDQGKPAEQQEGSKKKRPKMSRGKFWGIIAVVVVVVAVAGGGAWHWHEQPSFCAAFCHNMDQYLATYEQRPDVAGFDKYGNSVVNTSTELAVAHRTNMTTAKSDFRCMDCHHPIIKDQITEVTEWIPGNYYDPLYEPTLKELTKNWGVEDATEFCANENCHAYLLGEDGKLNREKLAKTTANREFNPHEMHHENLNMQCSTCHKGHRASVLACTSCHQHENVEVPYGWLTQKESNELMAKTFGS